MDQFLVKLFPVLISLYAGLFNWHLFLEGDNDIFSAEKNWQMLLDDLVGFLQQEQQKRQWKSISDYMKLQVSYFSSTNYPHHVIVKIIR